MAFEAIAIVGRACVLPGALTPDELWDLVVSGRDVVASAPDGRWRVARERILASIGEGAADHAWNDRGGYVDAEAFTRGFDPDGFALPADEVLRFDPLFQWILHTAREALRDASHSGDNTRVGAVFGNLSFPSASMSRFAESVWGAQDDTAAAADPRNRFNSGLPALVLEQALELGAGSFALDAACASSLYAIKTACDWLHDDRADLVLAGAVSCSDDLFIHVGFTALSALSQTGRSRPFNAAADGLVPAEGAALVALKRLADAERDGDRILGVIRGVGLSNDGRGRGFLVPSQEGQVRAIRSAYEISGLSGKDISLLECHATGTVLGDATEIASIREAFGDLSEPLPVGSLKSNMGHLITTAGAAALIKVIESMRAETRPPTLHVEDPAPSLDGAPLRVLAEAESWPSPPGDLRRAGISAFGFGGNNAHLIVEEYLAADPKRAARDRDTSARSEPVALVGIGVVAAGCRDREAFREVLFDAESKLRPGPDGSLEGRVDDYLVDVAAAGIPPNDLRQTLAQQMLVLDAGAQAAGEVGSLPRERTSVYVGMGTDAEIARYGARWRAEEGAATGDADAYIDVLESAGVIGTMPNIPANRLNRLLDLAGPSCSISAEERSGLEALDLAARALREGELDAALVAAVDLCCEPVHKAAARACLAPELQTPGDAAVALVLKRLCDAERDGDPVYAVLADAGTADSDETSRPLTLGPHLGAESLNQQFGHAHAASGLLHLAAAALCLDARRRPGGQPWLATSRRRARVEVHCMEGLRSQQGVGARSWQLEECDGPRHPSEGTAPQLHVYRGADEAEVLAKLAAGRCDDASKSEAWPACLVIVADDAETLAARSARAVAHLEQGAPPGQGVHFRNAPAAGDLAFVFTSAGSSYPGMGRELIGAVPELADRLAARFSGLPEAMGWVYADAADQADNEQRLWGASCLAQIHAELTQHWLGLRPDAAIGYSSGESNSLFALGAWTDMDAMRAEIASSGLYSHELDGSFDAVARAWGIDASATPVRWAVHTILAPLDQVRAAIANEARVHLAIVHTDNDCVIAGDADACERIVERIGAQRCHALDYDMAAHVPEVDAFREAWLDIHRRDVSAVPGVRFYSGGRATSYTPEREACTQAIMGQANATLDFSAVVERAWADGVRIFVEHGPMAACSGWIREILGERARDAVVVSMDRKGRGIEQVLDAIAALIAAGVAVDTTQLFARLTPRAPIATEATAAKTQMRLPAHPNSVRVTPQEKAPPARATSLRSQNAGTPHIEESPIMSSPPSSSETAQLMEPAPRLPSVLESGPAVTAPVHRAPETPLAPPPSFAPTLEGAVPVAAADPPVAPVHATPAPTGVAAQLRDITQVHEQFIESQAQVHSRFLALREGLGRQIAAPTPAALQPPVQASVSQPIAAPPAPSVAAPAVAAAPMASLPAPPARAGDDHGETISPSVELDCDHATPPSGLTLDRAQLEIHASGRISEIYGALFEEQDGYARQVRMPEPPLLLADRVTGIEAKPGVHDTGILWTETDVRSDSWYLNRGRMPAGVLIESGQADLMLISYMGTDFLNKGERVYRLLGCQLTFEDDLPKPGDTLCYEIHVDGHASQDDVRLFFFHYQCRVAGKPRISVRGGQAGFFSDQELADSAGILWSADAFEPKADPQLDPPDVVCNKSSFTGEEIAAFAAGRAFACFGDGFEHSLTHTATPAIQDGDMLFLDEIPVFDPSGGPWGRGYLRAESDVHADDWYFDGHFKNDPCMPGTLMFEGCLQALSFFLAGLGFSLERDGWRFQPVKGEPVDLRCRGQVTPESKRIVYEVFIEEVIAGPTPTIYADLLCTVDGLKAFHARRAGQQLVPDWPLNSNPALLAGHVESGPVAGIDLSDGGRFEFDYASLIACAWGRPSDAFGPMYARFDGPGRVPRLPGPPYHFMSRVVATEGPIGEMQVGSKVDVEYDIPEDVWYLAENGSRTMPFCVLLEAALQPCGWLASYIGSALTVDDEVSFRNLDGTGNLLAELFEDSGVLRTHVELTNVSQSSGMIIVSFDVKCRLGDRLVYDMNTVFGFFPPESLSLENQVGQPTTDEQRQWLVEPSDFDVDLTGEPDRYFAGSLCLGNERLRMLDRVTGFWPTGGTEGLGRLRGERGIDADDWYFKAHFFQDPVQPGSLGIEAMLQLLQFYMLETGMAEGIADARFEPITVGRPHTWKYRGQVVPRNELVHVTADITELGSDEAGPFVTANVSLWCDGIRIYSADPLGMRIVSGATPDSARQTNEENATETLDPTIDTWLADHCPTWNRPALPMMSIVDRLAQAVSGTLIGLREVGVSGWVDFSGPRSLRTEASERAPGLHFVRLLASQAHGEEVEVATALVETGDYPARPAALETLSASGAGNCSIEDVYANGSLFHGPAFQLARQIVLGADAASSLLDAGAGSVPIGRLHPALLDAALHSIPHDQLDRWSAEIDPGKVAYPARIPEIKLYGPTPKAGDVRCEVRFDGFLAAPDLPRFRIQWIGAEGVWAEAVLVEACFPKGPLGSSDPAARRSFLRDREHVPGLTLSSHDAGVTRLDAARVEESDWMPGTIEGIYGTREVEAIAIKEHIAQREAIHPSCWPDALPFTRPGVDVTREGDEVVVRDATPSPDLDLSSLHAFWNDLLGTPDHWLGQDLWEAVLQRYVRKVVVEDPDDFAALRGRGAIYVANHQVQIESLLITNILSSLIGAPVVTMANAKHETRWIGWILGQLFRYPGCRNLNAIVYFDQSSPSGMFDILDALKPDLASGERSFFVHPQGTRSQSCREPVTKISSLFLDLALDLDLPIVPIRFAGGLPVQPVLGKLEFPVGHAKQDYFIGRAIEPATLESLAYRDRGRHVLDLLNTLGPARKSEKPLAADRGFGEWVRNWSETTGASEVESTFFGALREASNPGPETQQLIDGANQGRLTVAPDDTGRWLAELAVRIFGPNGPEVEIERTK